MVLALACLGFAGFTLRHFMVRRITFTAHLDAGHSALTTSRYLRLMLIAVLEMIWSLTITIYILWFTLSAVPLRPWTAWSDVHSNFSRVDQYPVLFIPQSVLTSYYVAWLMIPVSTLLFVAFFAFGREAVEDYKRAWLWVRRSVLRQNINSSPSSGLASFDSSANAKSFAGGIRLPSFRSTSKALQMTSTSLKAFPPSSPYPMPTPPTPTKYRAQFDEISFDDVSEMASSYGPALSYHAPAVIDVALPTPSTIAASEWTESERTRPPSQRPFTYPSFDASHRGIPPSGAV